MFIEQATGPNHIKLVIAVILPISSFVIMQSVIMQSAIMQSVIMQSDIMQRV